ncbi:MAG: DUF3370 domain-containing protein [Synechococcales cyanobacterium RM1_1_8]|nr:DUF3370 domain-containing protein [Synechococcales cyanobacterium RM1_1_8]
MLQVALPGWANGPLLAQMQLSRASQAEVTVPQTVRPLPGSLDAVPVFNSNNPEIVQADGILLSTFPSQGKRYPEAHLNYPFNGRFDIFSHHISRGRDASETRSLFQGVLLHNPTSQEVRVEVLQASTYLTRPDALYVDLDSYIEDPIGQVFSGPGSRITNDVLRGRRQGLWPTVLVIPPRQSRMLMNLPIPVGKVTPSSNGRSSLARLWSSGPVYVANLAMFADKDSSGRERIPTVQDWESMVVNSDLVRPRDHAASVPGTPPDSIIFGRVAGVAKGSRWRARITDSPQVDYLTVPGEGRSLSYGLNMLPKGTLGTGQIQSAPMLARYPDSAFMGHGNYGIEYNLLLPLGNSSQQKQAVALSLQTPIKSDDASQGLRFFAKPPDQIFFRGTIRLRYVDDRNQMQTRYVHVVQRRGEQGKPLIQLNLNPGERRVVRVDFLYPPDATPPQVLTISTLDRATAQGQQPVLGELP